MKSHEMSRNRSTGAFMTGVLAVVAVVGAYVAHPALPHDPVHLPFEKHVNATLFLPEGWKFFTRDPQGSEVIVLRRTAEGAWAPLEHVPNGRASNFFGASRTGRAQTVETGRVAFMVPDRLWHDCTDAPETCFDRLTVDKTVKNISPEPTLCGTFGFARQKPVPWAWASSLHPVVMPSRVMVVEVQC
jgi:antimicrobial peptide system SdpA family protein